MTKQSDKNLFDALLTSNLFQKSDLENALKTAESSQENLDMYLIRMGLISKQQILSAFEKKSGLEAVDLLRIDIESNVIEKIPVKFAWYYKFMPIRIDGKVLTVAVSFPIDVKTQDEIRVNLGYEPRIVLSCESDIVDALKKHYGLAADMIDRILMKDPDRKVDTEVIGSKQIEDLDSKTSDASVSKLVNQIILEAYKKRATDIHIEPYRNKVRFRYRIDGALIDANLPRDVKHFVSAILSRIKIMSNLSIVEKRIPQDGSTTVKVQDQTLDLRISTMPTPQGESMVIRILPTKVMKFHLSELGLEPENVKKFRELISKPHGVIFVTGPTGSGKTTTLYACLNEVNSIERKIITIEDPVEYEMENVTQIQINPKVNLTFAAGLKSTLRHDPDIIMVGEVRDLETAEISIRTALTGHLVFSTLHTNDAASGIIRLIEMNVEPYLVSSSIEAFVAQRLVRVICKNCKQEVEAPEELKKEIAADLMIKDLTEIKIYKGRGCDRCQNTGYYGRTAIYEMLLINDVIRSAILENPRADFIKRMAIEKNGMCTLRQDGWKKVLKGITTPQEVMNATTREEPFVFEDVKEDLSENVKEVEVSNVVVEKEKKYRVVPRESLSEEKENEARVFSRIDEQLDVKYRLFQSDLNAVAIQAEEWEHLTHTKNISAGGVVLDMEYPLPIGSIVEVKVSISKKKDHPVECLARVCRVEKNENKKHYRVVVYFLDISSADRSRITTFVNERNNLLET